MPLPVSVIIPTHNRAYCLARAVDSVLAQSQPPLEIIVIDDGSTDETAALIARYGASVRYHRQSQRGVAAARNVGIGLARGEWIALLDSDDAWLPHKLARQWALRQSHPEFLLIHGEEIWIRRGRRVNPHKKHAKGGGWIYQRCLALCVISPSAALLHRDLLQAVGGFDESLPVCEDYDLWLRICQRYPVGYIETPIIIKYGGHDDQLSTRYWGMDRFRIQALEKRLVCPDLSSEDRRATLQTLQAKLAIFVNGASKRQREASAYRQRLAQVEQQLAAEVECSS